MKLELNDVYALEFFGNMGHSVDQAVPYKVTLMGGASTYVYLWEACFLELAEALPKYKSKCIFGVDQALWAEWVRKAEHTKGKLDDVCGLDAKTILNRIFAVAR